MDLKHLQVSNNPIGGWSRYINGWVDNIDIMNCINQNNCCIGSEIMGLSDLCLPDTNSAFYSVNDGADAYTWTVTGNATILSGQGTSTILVDFSNATNPVTISVTIECSCVETDLTKTITCPTSMITNPNDNNVVPREHKLPTNYNSLPKGNIDIYPNPSEGIYLLKGVELNKDVFTVTTITGQVVVEKQILNTNSIDISNQKDGVYLLIINEGTHQRVIKLVKTAN